MDAGQAPLSHVRRGRGKSLKSQLLIAAAIDILSEIHPASVRSVCYQLFVRRLITSMVRAETNAVSGHLVWARENGWLPWGWVVDETREAERVPSWDSPDKFIDAAVRSYRRNYWQDQPEWVEIWSEKGTVRGTLAPVLNEYGVTLRVMHGYGSATSLHDAAEEAARSSKVLRVGYVGDWDPSGLHMSEFDLPRRLLRYGGNIIIERIALCDRDVGPQSALPHFEAATKSQDPRHAWFTSRYGSRCWELDAMSPVDLRRRVESWIRMHLDVDAWERSIQVEKVETASMLDFQATWKWTISGRAPK